MPPVGPVRRNGDKIDACRFSIEFDIGRRHIGTCATKAPVSYCLHAVYRPGLPRWSCVRSLTGRVPHGAIRTAPCLKTQFILSHGVPSVTHVSSNFRETPIWLQALYRRDRVALHTLGHKTLGWSHAYCLLPQMLPNMTAHCGDGDTLSHVPGVE